MSESAHRRHDRHGASPAKVVRSAMSQVAELTGRPPDSVSALERTDDGWRVEVEVVDLERVPASTSVLASYEVEVDEDGRLVGYRRLRRYYRNVADEQ